MNFLRAFLALHDFEFSIDEVTKIEGHAGLEVRVQNNEVIEAKLKVSEGKRFFQEAAIGKNYLELPNLFARICGTCSVAHFSSAAEAIERAFDVTPSEQTIALRKLLIAGTILRDHGMHLYYFSLPDVFGKESILDFEGKLQKWVHDSMHVREAGVRLSEAVGGRSIHPFTATVGGFTAIPKMEELKACKAELLSVRETALELCEAFYEPLEKFGRKANNVALKTGDFSFIEGKIIDSHGDIVEEEDYARYLDEFVIPYSTAEEFEFEKAPYAVGALSRVNLNAHELHPDTRRDCAKFLSRFPSNNPFHNNLGQAIEIVQCIDLASELIDSYEGKPEVHPRIEPIESRGIGVIEAPRGLLYYSLFLDSNGKCAKAQIVIPTAQNAMQIESDIKAYLPDYLDLPREKIELQLEKIVRAYDPCMSCATHFLKVKWL
ncbi:MAG: nickel-dependent hydrogenase large subunit [archaeon]